MSHLNFGIFHQILTCLVTLFDCKLRLLKMQTMLASLAMMNETFLCFSNTVISISLKWCFLGVFGVKIQVNNRFVTTNPYLIFQKAKRKKNRKWSRHRLDDFRAICHKCTVQCTPRHIARTSYHKYKIHAILHNNAYCEIRSRFAPLKTFQKSRKRYDRVV